MYGYTHWTVADGMRLPNSPDEFLHLQTYSQGKQEGRLTVIFSLSLELASE